MLSRATRLTRKKESEGLESLIGQLAGLLCVIAMFPQCLEKAMRLDAPSALKVMPGLQGTGFTPSRAPFSSTFSPGSARGSEKGRFTMHFPRPTPDHSRLTALKSRCRPSGCRERCGALLHAHAPFSKPILRGNDGSGMEGATWISPPNDNDSNELVYRYSAHDKQCAYPRYALNVPSADETMEKRLSITGPSDADQSASVTPGDAPLGEARASDHVAIGIGEALDLNLDFDFDNFLMEQQIGDDCEEALEEKLGLRPGRRCLVIWKSHSSDDG